MLRNIHKLVNVDFVVQYIDENESSLLPINNDDNYNRALSLKMRPLRIIIQRKGESYGELHGYGQISRSKMPASKLISAMNEKKNSHNISILDDFRRVSSIIDVDIVPVTFRRVKLMRNSSKPLGFYIRDGVSVRATPNGIEKVPAIFISRLIAKGLAESTGLLAVNDEVIEVNGIEVRGKTLDQVTDMMVANSSNLIITVKPVNQNTCLAPKSTTNSANSSHHSQHGKQQEPSDHSILRKYEGDSSTLYTL